MTELAALFVFAYSESAVVITLVVVIILIALGLWASLWFFRKNLQLRRSLMFNRRVVKKCPYCDAVMDPEVNYCPNCGKEVPKVTTITPGSAT